MNKKTEPKQWNPGIADEAWKLIICAGEALKAETVLSDLIYILTEAGADKKAGLVAIRDMSGRQIIDGLLAFRDSAHASICNGLEKVNDERR